MMDNAYDPDMYKPAAEPDPFDVSAPNAVLLLGRLRDTLRNELAKLRENPRVSRVYIPQMDLDLYRADCFLIGVNGYPLDLDLALVHLRELERNVAWNQWRVMPHEKRTPERRRLYHQAIHGHP